MKVQWLMGLGAMALAGCATVSPSLDQEKDAARSSVATAQGSGAMEGSGPAAHLQAAQGELARADKAVKDGDDDRARTLYQRAQADADLATAQARDASVQGEAAAAEQKLQQVQQVGTP